MCRVATNVPPFVYYRVSVHGMYVVYYFVIQIRLGQ